MSTQVLLYEKLVPVSPENHRDLCVKSGTEFAFAAKVDSVPLIAAEFATAASEYAIVFAGNEEQVLPAVLLGMAPGQNLYVDADGHWDAAYVPAFVRRYPFVFALSDDGKTFTLCIDEDFAGCNRDGRGERLFDAEGEHTTYLNGVMGFQTDFQSQFRLTEAFCKRLVALDLLDPVQAEIRNPAGEKRVLTGIRAVTREKLKALSGEVLEELIRADALELIFLHLHSLANLRKLGARGSFATSDNTQTAPSIPAPEDSEA